MAKRSNFLETEEVRFTHPLVSLLGDEAQDDWLHGGDVSEPDFWNVEGADHMGPAPSVGPFQSTILVRAELATLKKRRELC